MIRDSYDNPLKIQNERGVEEVHRIITTCYKMDTQEYASFTHTKNINKDMKYGCAKCNDLSVDLMNPERLSFQHPRGIDQIIVISGYNSTSSDATHCTKFAEWNAVKGQGYTPCDLESLSIKYEPDPSHVITTDISHAALNIVQQLFVTLMVTEPELKIRAQSIFLDMVSICEFNNFKVKLSTKFNWSGSPTFLKDISLELAPKALV